MNFDDWRTFRIEQDKGRVLYEDRPFKDRHFDYLDLSEGKCPFCGVDMDRFSTDPDPEGYAEHDQESGWACYRCHTLYHHKPVLPKWVLQPWGEACDEVRAMWCPSCAEVKYVPRSCHSKTCPRCWCGWANEEADKITAKMAMARRKRVHRGRPWHVYISPPWGTVGDKVEDIIALRTKAYQIFKDHRVAGGSVVMHWGPTKGPFAGSWRPHIHAIVYLNGRYKPGPTDPDGWFIHFEKIKPTTDEKTGKRGLWVGVRKVAYYELSHCIRFEHGERHAVTWFGTLANNKFPTPEIEILVSFGMTPKEPRKCPDCGTDLEPTEIWDWTDPYSPDCVWTAPLGKPPPTNAQI